MGSARSHVPPLRLLRRSNFGYEGRTQRRERGTGGEGGEGDPCECASTKREIASTTVSVSPITSSFVNRRTDNEYSPRTASLALSRSCCDGSRCTAPSISTINRASSQKKSATKVPIGCWRRKSLPFSCLRRNRPHSNCSAWVHSCRSCRAHATSSREARGKGGDHWSCLNSSPSLSLPRAAGEGTILLKPSFSFAPLGRRW